MLYITKTLDLTENPLGASLCLLPPAYIENGQRTSLVRTSVCGSTVTYGDAENAVTVTVSKEADTLLAIRRTWKNTAPRTRKIQTVLAISPMFNVTQYLIPCVNINGNPFGAGLEPKGLTRDGKPWIFAYDRCAIPACTVTENDDIACSLFADADTAASLSSACSIEQDGNGIYTQLLYHPVIEAPLTYSSRDRYADAYESFLTLAENAVFETTSYLVLSTPRWKHYGICDTLDHALTVFGDNRNIAVPDANTLWDNSITFAKSLISTARGTDKKGFIIGFLPDEQAETKFSYRGDDCFELAWCGQNILFSRMLIEDFKKRGHKDSLALALEILDTRVGNTVSSAGLPAAQLHDFRDLNSAGADTCNMGYGIYELLRTYEALAGIGIDKPAYLDASCRFCDFMCAHFSAEYGFGKQWRLDGECMDRGGSIGGFVLPALLKCHMITGVQQYLETAKRAMRFYMQRDLDRFVCTAGALDTCCVDKETSFPFIIAGELLYEITGDPIFLTDAEKAASYFTAWMFHYNPAYDADSEIVKYNVTVKGLTAVSAQHHHLDMYAGIVVPYLRKLALLTGKEIWQTRADMMWRAVTQYIGDGELVIHDVLRPIGSQNEALFQCRWGFGDGKRGQLNDWLVAWPCAFRLSVLA